MILRRVFIACLTGSVLHLTTVAHPASAQSIEQSEGVLTAFANCEGKPNLYRIHFSSDGHNLGGGEIVYQGVSPVLCMMPYKGGVLTAVANCEGKPGLYRVHFSPDGKNLGGGEIVYQGVSPVTAMVPYKGGVLTAFTNCEGKPHLCRIHFSPDGKNLGGGEIRYEGISPVTAMVPYEGGVLSAFANVAGNPHLYRIHFSPDGKNLGGGPIEYEGISPVTAMSQYGANPATEVVLVGDSLWTIFRALTRSTPTGVDEHGRDVDTLNPDGSPRGRERRYERGDPTSKESRDRDRQNAAGERHERMERAGTKWG